MRCPYCISEISDEALACPRCARDLYLFKPLLAKIDALEKTIAEQAKVAAANSETRIAALEKEIADLKAAHANAIPVEVVVENEAQPKPGYAFAVIQVLLPALILLVAAHGFLLFVYDVKPLYLRVATLLIPVPFGFYLALHHPQEFNKSVIAAAALAIAGVFSMLAVTATIDKVPLLPQDFRDWRETIEYMLSIALAFTTGLLLGKYRAHRNLEQVQKNKFVLLLTRAFTPNDEGKLGIEKAYKKVNKMVEAVTPAATGAASVYAGIKSFFGDMG
jgi:hypothetical protein